MQINLQLTAFMILCCLGVSSAQSADDAAGWRWSDLETEAELGLEIQGVDGQDNPGETLRDTTMTELELKLQARQELSVLTELRAELELQARYYADDIGDEDDDVTWRVQELYVNHFNQGKTIRWRLGRQTLDDRMGWFIDEELDGLRFSRDWDKLRADISYTRLDWVRAGSAEREDETDNLLAALHFDGLNDTRWTPYVLYRSAHTFSGTDASDTSWLGVQGTVRVSDRFGYWVNAALRNGQRDSDDGQQNLGGYAVDGGASWTFGGAFKPTVTVGYARASGDEDTDDNDDDAFRQSGLHNNDYRLNGGSRFRYLGEVLDPELTNIEILTLGLGARPGKRWAVDVALHRYKQVSREDRIRGTDIEYEPSGLNGELGDALDVVVRAEPAKGWTVQTTAGLFWPGDAFDDAIGDAWLGRLEFEYDF